MPTQSQFMGSRFGARTEKIELFRSPSTISGASSALKRYTLLSGKEKVSCTTLDTFFQAQRLERARLLKIDVEGAEYEVIVGGGNVIRQRAIDFIALEYHPEVLSSEKIVWIHELLKKAGYILTKCRGQTIYHLPGLEKEIQDMGDLRVDASL